MKNTINGASIDTIGVDEIGYGEETLSDFCKYTRLPIMMMYMDNEPVYVPSATMLKGNTITIETTVGITVLLVDGELKVAEHTEAQYLKYLDKITTLLEKEQDSSVIEYECKLLTFILTEFKKIDELIIPNNLAFKLLKKYNKIEG